MYSLKANTNRLFSTSYSKLFSILSCRHTKDYKHTIISYYSLFFYAFMFLPIFIKNAILTVPILKGTPHFYFSLPTEKLLPGQGKIKVWADIL